MIIFAGNKNRIDSPFVHTIEYTYMNIPQHSLKKRYPTFMIFRKQIGILLLSLISISTMAQPKHEVRAAWLTTVYGLDWPQTRANTPAGIQQQKKELVEILDQLKAANFNTILFQTRARSDVFYPSSIEPFSNMLTGKVGKHPGYDPLAFAIEECHKRGMECHAWMVTIPLGTRKHIAAQGKHAITQKRKEICVSYRGEYYLNPGHPDTKNYLMSLVREVVKKYDIDGVHFDYLRYPEHAKQFPDKAQYRKHGKGRSLAQWRRDNITEIVRHIYKEVKAIKPWIKVSSSPVGKYDDTTRYPSQGWNALHVVHQDVQGWLAEGIQDQIYPMMYFKENAFYPFALDWKEQSNGRHIIPGLGIYFLKERKEEWSTEEIVRQIAHTRTYDLAGQGHYRAKYLMQNVQQIYDLLKENTYKYPALQPPMTWGDSIPPTVPTVLRIEVKGNGYKMLSWQPATDNDCHNRPSYVIYASDTYPVDTDNPKNIIAQGIKETSFLYTTIFPWEDKHYFAVTAVDRYGNESEAIQASTY